MTNYRVFCPVIIGGIYMSNEKDLIKQAKTQLELNYQLMGKLSSALEETKAENVALISENERLQDKGEFYDVVTQSSDTKDFGEVAKILNIGGIGRNKLLAIFRDGRVLDGKNLPYQTYVDRGYFKVVEVSKEDYYGHIRVFLKTVVFQIGIDWMRKQLSEMDII